MFANAACSWGRPIVADAACSWILHRVVAEHLRRRLDEVAGRRVERGDLVEDHLLVAQRLRDDHGGPQRGDRRGRRAVDALDQLDVVLDGDVDGQVVLDRHRELGEQVLVLLAHVEEDVLLEGGRLLGVGGLQRGDLRGQPRVEPLGDVDVLVQPTHGVPEVLLLHVERDVVLLELVLTVAQRVQDAVQVALRRLVLAEVVVDPVTERDHPEDLLAPARLGGVEVLDGPAQVEQGLADLAGLAEAALLERLDRRPEQPVARLGGAADVVVAHRPHIGRLGVERRRLGLGREERGHVALDLGVQTGDGRGGDLRRHLRRGGLVDDADRRRRLEGQDRRRAGRWRQGLHGLRGRRWSCGGSA